MSRQLLANIVLAGIVNDYTVVSVNVFVSETATLLVKILLNPLKATN